MRGKREDTHSVLYLGKVKLNEMFQVGKGTSKYSDKMNNAAIGLGHVPNPNKIYMDHTMTSYMKHWEDYCKEMKSANFKVNGHSPRTLEEAAKFMPQYIESLKVRPGNKPGSTFSAWSIRAYFAGAGKVLGLSAKDYDLPKRERVNITRSRGEAVRDKHFSEKKHPDLVEFCKCTGLRNASELQKIKGDCLRINDKGEYCINVIGKGKKERTALIVGSKEEIARTISKIQNTKPDQLVWEKVPSCADVHDYRAVYAQRIYEKYARNPKDIPMKERYCCRKDQSGKWYDRKAVMEVTRNLGHSRANVAVEHYLGRH